MSDATLYRMMALDSQLPAEYIGLRPELLRDSDHPNHAGFVEATPVDLPSLDPQSLDELTIMIRRLDTYLQTQGAYLKSNYAARNEKQTAEFKAIADEQHRRYKEWAARLGCDLYSRREP
jgi:hypothetical protein